MKALTDEEKMIIEAGKNKINELTIFMYNEIRKMKVSKKRISEIKKKAEDRGITLLKDVANLVNWEKSKDKEKRKKLFELSTELSWLKGIPPSQSNEIILKGFIKVLTSDRELKDPLHMLMTRKEASKSSRRKRIEKKYNIEKKIKIPLTPEEKKVRRRLRRKAKKEGLTVDEYISKYKEK